MFIIGSREVSKQIAVSALILSFGLCLYIGSVNGGMLRNKIEFKFDERERLRNSLQYASDLDRLEKYVTIARLKQDFKNQGLDLSRFSSFFEEKNSASEAKSKELTPKTPEVGKPEPSNPEANKKD